MLHAEGDTDDGDAEDHPEKGDGIRNIHIPPIKNQMTFMRKERQPLLCGRSTTWLPKGQRASTPSFRVCIPKGIPMIVINKPMLDTKYSSATKKPPNRTQIIFPRIFMCNRVL